MTPQEWARENFQYWSCEDFDQAYFYAWFTWCHWCDRQRIPIRKDDFAFQAAEELAALIWEAACDANEARRQQERRGEIIYTLWMCNGPDGEERGYNIEDVDSTGWIPPGPHWTLVGTAQTEREAKEWCLDK